MNNNNPPNPTTNSVSGPTSALTSYLRERGIHVRNQSRRERRQEEEARALAQEAEPEAMEGVESTSAAQSETILYRPTQSKKKKKDSSNDDDEDAFAPSSSRKTAPARARIIFCVKCKGRFVRRLDDETGQSVCPTCISGGPSKKKPIPRKRKIVAIQKEPISKEILPSLRDICIAVVASYVDDLDSFGIISEESVEKLAKIISKNRKLNDVTSRLFMEPLNTRLRLYDCTNMNEVSLLNISQFCPRLQYLQLVYCGNITDKVLHAYADRLPSLKSLQVSGAFLVKSEVWDYFFKTVSTRLEYFEVRHTARFSEDNVITLTKNCPNLRELRMGQLFNMDSGWLCHIAGLKNLTVLEIAWPSGLSTLQTKDVVDLLSKIGPQLTELSLKGGTDLEDKVLTKGILKYCTNLKKLNLEQCHKLTAKAMIDLMNSWKAAGLTHLNVERCILFDDKVLKAIVNHSGSTLQHLSIHSLEKITVAGLESLNCKELAYLDCGFIRSVDDFVVKNIIDSSASLETLKLFGCHMLTGNVRGRRGLNVIGRE